MKRKSTYGLLVLLAISLGTVAQSKKKVSFVGGARSLMTNNQLLVTDSLPDTTSVKRNSGGYALIDLGVNIKPNDNTEILGMFRIKNDYGGFWGAGVNFDVRQLWLKGIIAKKVRYQIGDINLKQTPFTLYNHQADRLDDLPEVFGMQSRVVDYEKFYRRNTWRQQGANVDFALNFSKYVKEVNFNGYMLRLGASNFASIPDRLMGGATVGVQITDDLYVGYNRASVFDVKGTVADSNTFHNNVNTINAKYTKAINKNTLTVRAEAGKSLSCQTFDTLAPELTDYFINASASFEVPKIKTTFTLGYLNVGPDFRSIGAQSKAINYGNRPVLYGRYTNAQAARSLSLLDVIADDGLYNRSINPQMAQYNQGYNIVMPFGMATFNRNGIYARVAHKTENYSVRAETYLLSEIRGMGTTALRNMAQHKLNASVNLNNYLKTKNKFKMHAGLNIQTSKRTGASLGNVDFKRNIITAGLQYELFKNMEILGGLTMLSAKGTEFTEDRNDYEEVTYFNQTNYDNQQRLLGGGLKYNFTDKIYLSAYYQSIQNQLANQADYTINQFGILYNMTF